MEIFKSNGSFCTFYRNFGQNFIYTQNEQKQSPYLKKAPFKCLKCKFANDVKTFFNFKMSKI